MAVIFSGSVDVGGKYLLEKKDKQRTAFSPMADFKLSLTLIASLASVNDKMHHLQ